MLCSCPFGFIGQELVAHFSVMLYCANILMPKQLGDCPVIQMQFCQLDAIRSPEHMCVKFEELAIIIPQVFFQDQLENFMFYCGIL